jgi:hypothetical protein
VAGALEGKDPEPTLPPFEKAAGRDDARRE